MISCNTQLSRHITVTVTSGWKCGGPKNRRTVPLSRKPVKASISALSMIPSRRYAANSAASGRTAPVRKVSRSRPNVAGQIRRKNSVSDSREKRTVLVPGKNDMAFPPGRTFRVVRPEVCSPAFLSDKGRFGDESSGKNQVAYFI